MNIEYSLYVNAPVQDVFSLVDDKDNLKLWMDDVVETIYLENHQREAPIGRKFIQKIKEGRHTTAYSGEVVAYDRLRHLAVTLGNRQFTVRVDYRFIGDAGQTRLDYQARLIEGSWLMRLTGKLFASFTRKILLHQMWRLKAVAESMRVTACPAAERLAA